MTDERTRKEQGKRLAVAREAAGYRSAREAALQNGWAESSYRAHENGTRTIGQDDAERYARRYRLAGVDVSAMKILFGEDEHHVDLGHVVPIMGRIGAGAEIEPDFEQIPPEGIEQVELPYPIADDFIGFQVVGDSMAPAYEENAIILVEREQPFSTDGMIGLSAAITAYGPDGERRRYLKRIRRGDRPHTFNLESINDRSPTIRDVRIAWASPVRIIIPNIGLRRLPHRPRPRQPKPSSKSGSRQDC